MTLIMQTTLLAWWRRILCLAGFFIMIIITYIMKDMTHNVEPKFTGNLEKIALSVSQHRKWIVATTINHPTKALIALSQLSDWKMVVVGDRKSPTDWDIPGVVFLDVAAQNNLQYKIIPLLPYDRYTRKSIGYLYAIQHGARYIYETDDDNIVLDDLRGFLVGVNVTHGLMPATRNLTFNPYPHFGQVSIWPRGYPLEDVGQDIMHNYRLCSMPQAFVRQALANGDPDVDAVFRLTRRHHSDDGKLMFDSNAPRILIPRGTFVPFNSQDTLFTLDAFWAMILPATLSDRACDIYRSYWAQTLLWLVDGNLGFYPPNVMHVRNKHSFLKDLAQETRMYQDMARLVKVLHQWNCGQHKLYVCMVELAEYMVMNNFWLKRDADVIKAWVTDLTLIGYSPPILVQSRVCSNGAQVKYFPHEQNTSFAHTASMSHVTADRAHYDARLGFVQRLCNEDINCMTDTKSKSKQHNRLLVVTIHSHTTMVHLIDAYYRCCYTHILYCGNVTIDNALLHKWKISYVTIRGDADAITCMKIASKIGYNVDGFVHVSDRMLLLHRNIPYSRRTDQLWVANNVSMTATLCTENTISCFVLSKPAITKHISKIDELKTNIIIKIKLKDCLRRLMPKDVREAYFVENIVFYVPNSYINLFRALADIYIGTYSHMSVLALGCLESESLYSNTTGEIMSNHKVDFIFPFTFNVIDTDHAAKSMYCDALHSC